MQALGQLQERRRLSGVAEALKLRQALLERQALAWCDGSLLDIESLSDGRRRTLVDMAGQPLRWARALDHDIRLDALTEPSALLDWLGVSDIAPQDGPLAALLSYKSRIDILEAVTRWRDQLARRAPDPPLLQGARMALLWRQMRPLGRSDMVAAVLLGDRFGPGRMGLSEGGLVAIGLKALGPRWLTSQGTAAIQIWLEALYVAAQQLLELEQRLRFIARRHAEACADLRASDRLPQVLALARAQLSVSAAGVAKRLKISPQTAHVALSKAEKQGLLHEITGQASYRRYALPLPLSLPTPAVPAPTSH